MSFTKDARRVRNFRLPLTLRRSALGRCIAHLVLYSGLYQAPRSRDDLVANLERMRQIGGTAFFVEQAKGCPNLKFDLDRIHQFTEEELLDALRLVEAEWNRFLVRRHAFDQKRIRQKMRGIRQPRRADIDALYNRVTDRRGPPAPVRPAPILPSPEQRGAAIALYRGLQTRPGTCPLRVMPEPCGRIESSAGIST